MVGDAIMLTKMLRDPTRTSLLEHIRQELASSIKEVEGRLVILEKDLSKEIDLLAKRRAELSRLQDAAIHRIIDLDRQNRRVIGLALGEGLKELYSADQTRPEKHALNADGMEEEELSEEITWEICKPATKRANGMELIGNENETFLRVCTKSAYTASHGEHEEESFVLDAQQ